MDESIRQKNYIANFVPQFESFIDDIFKKYFLLLFSQLIEFITFRLNLSTEILN